MNILIDAEKESEKIQHIFMTKKQTNKLGIEGYFLNLIKGIFEENIAHT